MVNFIPTRIVSAGTGINFYKNLICLQIYFSLATNTTIVNCNIPTADDFALSLID